MAIDGGKIIAAVKDKTSYELVEEIKQGSLRGGHVMPMASRCPAEWKEWASMTTKMLKEEEIRSLRKNFILGQHYLLLSLLSLPDYFPFEADFYREPRGFFADDFSGSGGILDRQAILEERVGVAEAPECRIWT